jgi:RHS repeat-associated protein
VFNTPARLTLPNRGGYLPGLIMDLWSINPNTGLFDKVGKGKVSADASVIETISGGIRNSSWHFFALPPAIPEDPNFNPYNSTPGNPTCPAAGGINSEVVFQTGAVTETHNFATYQSLGTTRGISLTYNSLRADARPILHFNYDNVDPNVYSVPDALRLVAKLKVTGSDNFSYQVPGYAGGNNLIGGENFWKLPAGGGKVDAALQMDLRAQASGQYDYTLNSGILGYSAGANGYIGTTADSTGKIIIVNSVNSAFGSGWNLNGLQEIVKNKDGSVLLIDGNGQKLLFQASLTTPGTYTNPTGDFSTLKQLGDGTFERTLKDGTVYLFNANNQLADMKDRQGNHTQYRYDPTTGKLTQMVDPTGLTTFNYTGNRITSIVDPIGRTTKMEYDTKGNLTKITDPDGTYRQWEYDADHHLTAAIDKAGGRGEDFYDFAGRAYKGIRPDGSVIQINPIEVQGLYRPDLTNNPNTAPIATALAAKPTATYLDGNGNPLVNNIDKFGQATAAKDGVGKLSTTERNSSNLVTTTTSATGGKIDYTYDERGNVIATNEQIVQPGLTQFSQWTPQTPVSFNGQNSYVSLSNSGLVSNSTNSTVEMWVKLNQLGNTRQSLYSEDNTGGVTFEISYNSGFLQFGVWRTDVASNWRTISAPFGYKDEWVHVTSVLDATKGMQLYVNGTLVAANTDPRPSNATQISSSLGRFSNGGGGAYFNGEIGDVRLWNTARSTQQIQADIKGGNLTGQEAGLVGYWQFKEESGTKITDLTSNGRNGQLKGSATWDINPTSNVPQQLVYSNDFETLAGAEWSSNRLEGSAPALTKFLGRFNNETETLTLDTTPGETYKLNFDLYTIDSWDGTSGSDYFNVAIDGTQVFHNSFSAFSANDQTFRATDRLENFGFAPYANWPEGIYRGIPLTFTATGNTTKISFAGSNLSPQYDESWGIDNVRVNQLTVTTDALLHTTKTSYDKVGNVLTTSDGLENQTTYLYDKNNRRIQVTDAKGGTTKTGYDAVGKVATVTDSVNNTTTYSYDEIDRLITDTNQLNKTRTRSYDNVGNLTQTTDRNGRKVAYDYDTLNRQTSERWLDSSNGTIKTFSASYDAVGHLVSSTNPDAAYTYTYDAVDRVTSIDNTGTVGVPAVKFNYGYDAVGNLLSVNDSINGTNAGITGYTYDLLNRVTKLTQGGTGVQTKRVNMAYNAVNQLTGLSRYSGVNPVVDTSYTYDLNQRLIQLSHKKGVSTVASYDYSYDNADKLAATVSSVDGTSNYSYDSTNQLTGASHTAQTNEAYSYDANGNRTSGGTVTGVNNQLLNDGTYSYQYDGEGNRTKRTEIATGKVTEYIWDYRNRLAGVLFKDAGGSVTKTIDYIYDGNNQRIGKRIDGAVTERYVIDRNQIALVFDGAGTQTHRYLYGTQVDQVLADETPTGMVWALADNQGTVKDLVDNNGVVVNHITYDSFGKVVAQSNASVEFRYGYTGREQDGETGLDYYRARYYDAGNGRFLSEDPIGFGAGDGNLTRYVFNSPTNFTDPSGKIVPVLVLVALGVIAAEAFAPNNAEAPTSRCDHNPTPPERELQRATIELTVGAAPGAIRSLGTIGGYAAPRIGNALGSAFSRINPRGLVYAPVEGGLDNLDSQVPNLSSRLGQGLSQSGAAGIGASGSDLVPSYFAAETAGGGSTYPIHNDSQAKHIYNTKNYTQDFNQGKVNSLFETESINSVLPKTPQQLVDKFAGTGRQTGNSNLKLGDPDYREIVNFQERVGFFRDPKAGTYSPTNYGMIRYAGKGVHIVPANPIQY